MILLHAHDPGYHIIIVADLDIWDWFCVSNIRLLEISDRMFKYSAGCYQ